MVPDRPRFGKIRSENCVIDPVVSNNLSVPLARHHNGAARSGMADDILACTITTWPATPTTPTPTTDDQAGSASARSVRVVRRRRAVSRRAGKHVHADGGARQAEAGEAGRDESRGEPVVWTLDRLVFLYASLGSLRNLEPGATPDYGPPSLCTRDDLAMGDVGQYSVWTEAARARVTRPCRIHVARSSGYSVETVGNQWEQLATQRNMNPRRAGQVILDFVTVSRG